MTFTDDQINELVAWSNTRSIKYADDAREALRSATSGELARMLGGLSAKHSDLADALVQVKAERDEARKVGSCWAEGPTLPTAENCYRPGPLCDLPSGHAGAHESGRTKWMSHRSRVDLEAENAALRDVIREALAFDDPAYEGVRNDPWVTGWRVALRGVRRILSRALDTEKGDAS